MNLYLRWIGSSPNVILLSYKAYAYFGPELMGLPTEPCAYCPDDQAYGINL